MHGSIMEVYLFVKFEDILQDKPAACDHFWNEKNILQQSGKIIDIGRCMQCPWEFQVNHYC